MATKKKKPTKKLPNNFDFDNQKKVGKLFKQAAKDGTLGRGTLVKKHGKSTKKPCTDCGSPVRSTATQKIDSTLGYAVGIAAAKELQPLFPIPGEIPALFTFQQIMDLHDRRILTNFETRMLLGLNFNFKKEESNDSDSSRDEAKASEDKATTGPVRYFEDECAEDTTNVISITGDESSDIVITD